MFLKLFLKVRNKLLWEVIIKSTLKLLSFLFLALACGVPEPEDFPVTINYSPPEADTYLYISDSIGIDMGDSNYVFASISAVTLTTDGNLAILDFLQTKISLFNLDGEFISYIGRKGSAPGEYLLPAAIAPRPDGGLMVSEGIRYKLIAYDSNNKFLSEQSFLNSRPPLAMIPIDGGEIIALKTISVFDENDEAIETGYTVAKWANATDEPTVTYYSRTSPFNLNNTDSKKDNAVLFAASTSGIVFTSNITPEIYSFTAWASNGEELYTFIDENFQPQRRTQEEIDLEIERHNQLVQGTVLASEEFDVEVNTEEFAIDGMFVDGMDRLWVGKGSSQTPYFDVFDLNGEHLFTAALDAGLRSQYWNTVIVQDKFICYNLNPEDYPRVFYGDLPGFDE